MTDYFTSSAQLDEHMAEVVKKHPLLYDKQKNGYRDEGMKAETWQKVADECDVGTGDAARKLFDNLKKRFLKKRLKYRKLKAGGVSPDLVNAAKDEMDSYAFLNWLVPHIRMRRTKRDLNVMEMSGMMEVKPEFYGSDEGGSSFDEQETFDDDGEMENASMVSSSANYIKPIHSHQPHQKTPTPPMADQRPSVNGTNGESLKRKAIEALNVKTETVPYKKRHGYVSYTSPVYGKTGSTRRESLSPLDDIDLFGKMIAAEIKQLPARDQCIAKHQIHTVLFELKMSHFSQTAGSQWQSSQPVYVVSSNNVPHLHRSQSRQRYSMDPYYPADSSLKESND